MIWLLTAFTSHEREILTERDRSLMFSCAPIRWADDLQLARWLQQSVSPLDRQKTL